MQIKWTYTKRDIELVRGVIRRLKDDPFVKRRHRRNVRAKPRIPNREKILYSLVLCLLTTQQRSGPKSRVSRYLSLSPFPLTCAGCQRASDVRRYALKQLKGHGLRRTSMIAAELKKNHALLNEGGWEELRIQLTHLVTSRKADTERAVAKYIQKFHGIGPKQSRNFLQVMGLTRYEIPLDSRITKWLNDTLHFPVRLSAQQLADEDYYCFVEDAIIALCRKAAVFPCMLDAAIFASYDNGGWAETEV